MDGGADSGAEAFWLHASDTFVADRPYYDRVAQAIQNDVLPLLAPDVSVLDIGCGEGTFTAFLAASAGHVDAFDLSPTLIEEAQSRQLPNVDFEVGNAREAIAGAYGLVSCMGVLVCIVDDDAFRSTLRSAAQAVEPGGLLVLRETFSGWGRRVIEDGDYVACYRPRRAYLDELGAFELVVERRLGNWSRLGRRVNDLWVLRRT